MDLKNKIWLHIHKIFFLIHVLTRNFCIILEIIILPLQKGLVGWVRVALQACLIRMVGTKCKNIWYCWGRPAPEPENTRVGLTHTFLKIIFPYYSMNMSFSFYEWITLYLLEKIMKYWTLQSPDPQLCSALISQQSRSDCD